MEEGIEHREKPGIPVPQGVVLDFDRTLADPSASMSRFYKALDGFTDIDTSAIANAQIATETTGDSFEPFSHIRGILSEEQMEAFKRRFIAMDEPPLFYEDVSEFLAMLDQNNIPHSLLSKGMDQEWQALKIAASGYKGPITIIDHDNKGGEIADRRTPSGTFQFRNSNADIFARSVCLIDDKPTAFNGLPNDCSGYLLVRSKQKLPSQQGKLPEHISTTSTLRNLHVVNGVLNLRQPQ